MAKRQVRTRRNVSPIDRVNRERKSALATREIAGKTVAPVRTGHWKHQPTRLAFLRMSMNCLSAIHSLNGKVSLGLPWEIRRSACTRKRSEEHTSELQSLMSLSYAVFCLKKKKHNNIIKILNSTLLNIISHK